MLQYFLSVHGFSFYEATLSTTCSTSFFDYLPSRQLVISICILPTGTSFLFSLVFFLSFLLLSIIVIIVMIIVMNRNSSSSYYILILFHQTVVGKNTDTYIQIYIYYNSSLSLSNGVLLSDAESEL